MGEWSAEARRAMAPWALVAAVVGVSLAIHPPRLVPVLASMGEDTNADVLRRALDQRAGEHAATLVLGDSRVEALFGATEVSAWAGRCGLPQENALALGFPFGDFSNIGPLIPRLDALGPELVVLQLDLLLRPEKDGGRVVPSGAALGIGLDFVQRLRARGVRVVVVDLPLRERHRAERAAHWGGAFEDGVAAVEAMGVPVLRAPGGWADHEFDGGVHLTEQGAARARAWLCEALSSGSGHAAAQP